MLAKQDGIPVEVNVYDFIGNKTGMFGMTLTIELTATLANAHVVVTAAEQRELRDLLAATDMPTGPADQLDVRADGRPCPNLFATLEGM